MNDTFGENFELLLKCFSGDMKARETLVRRYTNLVYQSVCHILNEKRASFSSFDVEDLHNTVFLKLFDGDCKKLKQYKGENRCSLATWIKVVTVHIVLDHLRKKGWDSIGSVSKSVSIDEVFQITSQGADALEKLETLEKKRLYEKAILHLSPRDRLFLKLHIEKELSVREVAQIMGLTISNAYTIKHRIIQKTRLHIKRTLGEELKM